MKQIKLIKNFKKLSFQKNTKVNEQLSEEIIINEFKNLKMNKNKKVKIANKIYHFDRKELRIAIRYFKRYQHHDNISELTQLILRDSVKNDNDAHKILAIIRLQALSNIYPLFSKDNVMFDSARKIYHIIILKLAHQIDVNYYNKLAITKQHITNNIAEYICSELNIQKYDFSKYWNSMYDQIKISYLELNLEHKLDLLANTIIYWAMKYESQLESSKNKGQGIFARYDVPYIKVSDLMLITNDKIVKNLMLYNDEVKVEYTKVLQETNTKLHLSDLPPLTISGYISLGLNYLILLLWAVIIAYPICQLIIQTFNKHSLERLNTDRFTFSLDNFDYLFKETNYTDWLINSLIVATVCMVLTVFVISLIGFAFSRFRFKGKKSGLMAVMLLQMIPTFAAIIAFYVLYRLLNDNFDVPPLAIMILIYTGGSIAGNTFVLKGFLDNVSTEIDEAARIDGCGNWKIYSIIIMPLARPMLAIIALWSFIGPFGDVILPQLLLSDNKDYTLAAGLNSLITDSRNMAQGSYAAGALLVALPITILFVSLQKNITSGLTAGGVKG